MDWLSSKNKQVTAYIIQAQEEEIKRISTEIHEGMAQTLYSIHTGLQFIQSGVSEELRPYTFDMIHSLEQALEELRRVSIELRPPSLDKAGLLAGLNTYSQVFTSTFGIEVNIEVYGSIQRFPPEVEIALFRICQEALFNAAKYADTERVNVLFTWKTDNLTIVIEDFGKGFDVDLIMRNGTALGLAAIKQRIELLNGYFTLHSRLGEGTMVKVTVPLTTLTMKEGNHDSYPDC
jgi:signal transduction histidine kinase